MKMSFVAGGGSNYIGGSFYVLKIGDINIGIDCGANLWGWENIEPALNVVSRLDYLFFSHAHFDHIGLWPVFKRKFPEVKAFGNLATKELGKVLWGQTLRKAIIDSVTPPFTEEEAKKAYEAINVFDYFPIQQGLRIDDDIAVYAIPAGHILGASSFLINCGDDIVFFTGDLCFRDRSLIEGAPLLRFERSRVLIRESTYITEKFNKTREEEIENLVNASDKVIQNGGKVLIAALSIDRAQDIFSILDSADLGPIYIDGSRSVFGVYRRFLPDAKVLDKAQWFKSKWERKSVLESREPAIIIASSGMMYKGSPSAILAQDLIYREENAVFLVNYQDPAGQGYLLANAKKGQVIPFNGSSIRVKCNVRQFNFSAHIDGLEGEELEERANPDTIIYVHGEDPKIDEYMASHSDARRRVKAITGKEVEL